MNKDTLIHFLLLSVTTSHENENLPCHSFSRSLFTAGEQRHTNYFMDTRQVEIAEYFLAYTDHVWSSDLNKRMFSFKRIRDDSGSGWKQANISFSYIFVLDPSNYMSVRLGRRAGS